MTYKEFEKWCEEEEGYVCNRGDKYLTVYDNECSVLFVGVNAMYSIDSDCIDCTSSIPKKLFEKAVELASTPLEEREEIKKYIVKVPTGMDGGFHVLGRHGVLIYMSGNYDTDLTSRYELTEEEIKEIDERFMAFAEEVEQ